MRPSMLLTLAPLLFSPTEAQVTPQIAPQLQPQVQPQVAPQEGPGTTPQAPLDIQYNKFSRTTCMASSGPVLTSKPGDCITLQHADQGIRVHATNLNVQCKLRAYATRDCTGPAGKWIGIGRCNPLGGDHWSLKVFCPMLKA